jgi:hypothetical protein
VKLKLPRIHYRLGLMLILLCAAATVLADSMSPFLSMTLDGFFAVLIVIVVWRMSPPKARTP